MTKTPSADLFAPSYGSVITGVIGVRPEGSPSQKVLDGCCLTLLTVLPHTHTHPP